MSTMTGDGTPNCSWCRRNAPANSGWEQQSLLSGKWSELCKRCASNRLDTQNVNPVAAWLIRLRRVSTPSDRPQRARTPMMRQR